MDAHVFFLILLMPAALSTINLPDILFESTSGCYGDTMNATCKKGEVIAITEAHVGVKPNYLNCPLSSNISSDFETCCIRNATDCTFPLASYKYGHQCNGQTSCKVEIEQSLDLASCSEPNWTRGDNTTDIFHQRHYMFLEHYCIKKAKLMDICNYPTSLSAYNTSLYMWHLETVNTTYQDIGSYCACSVEIDNCNSQLQIYSMYMESTTHESVGTCNQSITIYNSRDRLVLNLPCQGDNHTSRLYTVNYTYIQLHMSIPENNLHLNFLAAVRASKESHMTIQCPPSTQLFCTNTDLETANSTANTGLTIGASLGFSLSVIVIITYLLCRRNRKRKRDYVPSDAYGKTQCHSSQQPIFIKTRNKDEESASSENVDSTDVTQHREHQHPRSEHSASIENRHADGVKRKQDRDCVEFEKTNYQQQLGTSMTSDCHNKVETGTQMEIAFCKEKTSPPVIEQRIQVVKPLKTSTRNTSNGCSKPAESGKEEEVKTSYSNLDWNTIFRRLILMLPAAKWKLFFICLYGYGDQLNVFPAGMSVDGKISQIEARVDTKLTGVETLFFELFKEWRELFGEHTDPCYIENALKEMGYNDVLDRFKSILRNPPLLRSSTTSFDSQLGKTQSNVIFPPIELNVHKPVSSILSYAVHSYEQSQQAIESSSKSLEVRCRQSNEFAVHKHNMASTSQSGQAYIRECPQHLTLAAYNRPCFAGQKRHFSSTDSDSDIYINNKLRKHETQHLPKRRSTHRRRLRSKNSFRQSGKLISSVELNVNSFIDLIMRYLPFEGQVLNEKEYHLFLDHTISIIMKKTHMSERNILSILCADYHEVQEYKSKRFEHVHFVIETESTCMTLDKEEWNCLKLYADHARKRVVERCERTNKCVASKYLFIRFDGTPLLEKLQVSDSDEHVNRIITCQTVGDISFTGAQMSSETNGHTVDVKTSTHEYRTESSMNNFNNFVSENTDFKLDKERHFVNSRQGRRYSI